MTRAQGQVQTNLGWWQIFIENDALVKVHLHAEPGAFSPSDDPLLQEACRQAMAYSAGDLRDFDLPLAPKGPEFHQRVWAALQRIPYGQTTTYGELAQEFGGLTMARAVGQANAKNPIFVMIPCHRVIGKAGALTGYAAGISLKSRLLELEQGLIQPGLDI